MITDNQSTLGCRMTTVPANANIYTYIHTYTHTHTQTHTHTHTHIHRYTLILLDFFVHRVTDTNLETLRFGSCCASSSNNKRLPCWTPYIMQFSVTGYHWNTHKCRWVPEKRTGPRVISGKIKQRPRGSKNSARHTTNLTIGTIRRAINTNIMQNHNTRTEEPNTTNTNCGEAANLQGIKTCYKTVIPDHSVLG